jgi:hypothetical protein
LHPPPIKTFVAAIAAGGLIWVVAPALADVPNANSIACPNAPSGWTLPAGEAGRLVQSPDPSDATEHGLQLGSDQVRLTCSYFKHGNRMTATVSYALPLDFNPWWDFDFGCTSVNHAPGFLPPTGFPWDSQHRLFFVLSDKSWSYAEFEDPYNILSSGDVGPFESITSALLASAQPAAHNCQLPGDGGPVAAQAPWTFYFNVTATDNDVTVSGGSKGSFVTAPNSAGLSTGVISQLHASNIFLTATTKGTNKTKQITIHVGAPISFRAYYANTLKTAISVVDSNDPSCPPGSTGTMTVSTAPAVTLDICGGTLLQGRQLATASISNT